MRKKEQERKKKERERSAFTWKSDLEIIYNTKRNLFNEHCWDFKNPNRITILLHSNCIFIIIIIIMISFEDCLQISFDDVIEGLISAFSYIIYFFRSMSIEILSMVRAQGVGRRKIEF
jgi:hypothetical protein